MELYQKTMNVLYESQLIFHESSDGISWKYLVFQGKLNISWNSGLANYSYLGPYLTSLYRYLPLEHFLRYPKYFHQII